MQKRVPSQDFKESHGGLFRIVSMHRVLSYNGLDQRTDVYRAAELGDSERLASLLSAGSTTDAWGKSFFVDMHDDIDWRNEEGETALYAACFNGQETCVTLLLNANATVHLPDKSGHTPLTACCFKSRLQCAQLLLLAGADISRASHKGKTALDWARWREAQPNAPPDATTLRVLLEEAGTMGARDAVSVCRLREKADTGSSKSGHWCREYCTPSGYCTPVISLSGSGGSGMRDYCSPSALLFHAWCMLMADPDDSPPTSPKGTSKNRGFLGA